jgi:hypothetical protein
MYSHINEEELVGYLYRTLTDARREVLDAHLQSCPECRSRLSSHEVKQRRIHNDLRREINGRKPSTSLRFSGIAPQLRPRVPLDGLWQPLFSSSLATVGVVLAILGVWRSLPPWPFSAPSSVSGPFPAVAGLLFGLALFGQFDWKLTRPPSTVVSALVAFLLWLGTAILGLQTMVVLRDLFLLAAKWVGVTDIAARPMSMLFLLVLVMLWITMTIGGGEYHRRRVGQMNSWRLFGVTIAIELSVIIAGYWIFA